jgi:uncharacterized membrane protein YgdD (TMEM256/DUF423 family)
MVFGFVYFLASLLLGMYMAFLLDGADAHVLTSEARKAFRGAHAHANLESLLNIFFGYLLCRLAIEAWVAKVASALLIIGALLHSGMLILASLGLPGVLQIAPVGSLLLVAMMALMAYGVLMTKQID